MRRKSAVVPPIGASSAGARLAMGNAQRHLRCADAIASIGETSTATAHLVLSVEEAVKSMALTASAIALPIPERDLKRLLVSHDVRHATAGMVVLFSYIIERIMTHAVALDFDNPVLTAEQASERRAELVKHLVADAHSFGRQGDPSAAPAAFLSWFAQAKSMKESGFYVDYTSNGWRTPDSVSTDSYATSRLHTETFLRRVGSQLDGIAAMSEDQREILRSAMSYGPT